MFLPRTFYLTHTFFHSPLNALQLLQVGKRSESAEGRRMENLVFHACRMWYIYSVYIFSYIHNPGVHGRFYGLDFK